MQDILINWSPQETRVAVVEHGAVQELHVERTLERGLVGNVYLGKVSRVLPGMQSAFIDIGLERTAFLHVADIVAPFTPGSRPMSASAEREPHRSGAMVPIEKQVFEGQSLLVQVIKDPIGTKGARLSTQISIAGRLLVFLPQDNHIGVSQKIPPDLRDSLRARMHQLIEAAAAAEGAAQSTDHGGFIQMNGKEVFRQAVRVMVESSTRSLAQAGLTADDITATERDLYATLVWHLLADDRVGKAQEGELQAIRKGFDIADDDVPIESNGIEQFRSLRAVASGLPRANCPVPLAFQEYCIQQAPLHTGMLFITNRRLIIEEKKRSELPLPKVYEVVVTVDDSTIVIKTDQKKPLRLRTGNPIFTAGLIDFASELDERPKGFA